MKRILSEISEERSAQVLLGYDEANDDELTGAQWIAMITRHAGLAISSKSGRVDDIGLFRRQMIRVAAIAAAAVQSIDRSIAETEERDVYPAGPTSEQRGKGY